jgi:PRTRC genetic system ThiF family protein
MSIPPAPELEDQLTGATIYPPLVAAVPALAMEPTYRVVLGEIDVFRILLVGVGGTGSTLALFLAGLMYHARQKGIQVELTLVDPDVVEMKNCGRQNFSPAEASSSGELHGELQKAATLALRLNAAYGLAIAARSEAYQLEMGSHWFSHDRRGTRCQHLILGCLDNHHGRREIARTVEAYQGRLWAIDSGNDLTNGQVLIGNTVDVEQIRLDPLGLCSGLPSPYLQEPGLLEPEPETPILSCAGLMLADAQSLMVNRMAAAIAAQYVTEFVLQRQVSQLGTTFNLSPTVMRPILVTRANLGQCRPH